MKFRTEITIPPKPDFFLEHHFPVLTLGSCFAEHIAALLKRHFFDVLDNPFGVLYNPWSVTSGLELIRNEKEYPEEQLISHDGEWHSFHHHSTFSHHDKAICLANINEQLRRSREFLKTCQITIITYGTAYVFRHRETQRVVANCHKIPAGQFQRSRLTIPQIESHMESTIRLLLDFNPDMKIIFSVSPVRHLKDGLAGNQLSKSSLICALHEVIENRKDCAYFPAYEILMDDLRDYRFYAADLIHPNEVAIQYIWDTFGATYFSQACRSAVADFRRLDKALNHTIGNRPAPGQRKFINQQLELIGSLASKYPHADLREAEKYFKSWLTKITGG